MWIVPGLQLASGEVRDGRRPIGKLDNEALAGNWFNALGDPVYHRLGAQNHRDHGGDLHRLVGSHAEGAVLIDLAVGVEVSDMNDAREQNQGDAEDSQDRGQGNRRTSL